MKRTSKVAKGFPEGLVLKISTSSSHRNSNKGGNIVKRIIFMSVVAMLISSIFPRDGQALTVRGFNDTRSITGSVSGESFSFVTGPGFSLARSLLLDPVNFGPSGTVPEAITLLPSVNEISVSALEGTDVFIISPMTPELTPTEVCLLENYVQQGGALFEVRNVRWSRPTILGTAPGTFVGDSTAEITVAGATSAIIAGPFGTVVTITTGANGNYSEIGEAVAIATNSGAGGAGPNILLLSPQTGFTGLGRAVFIGDEEIFMTGLIAGERAGQLDPVVSPFNDNTELLLNIFAFLAGTPGLSADADFTLCLTAEVHDLAIVSLKAPKNINLTAATPALTKQVKVQIQNRSPHDETIPDLDTLRALVNVTVESLGTNCPAPAAVLIDGPPNVVPRTLKSKQKFNVFFEVTFDCANDPLKSGGNDPGHEDFSYAAHVNHAALDGNADTHTVDDHCPRSVTPPSEIDPNPNGKIKDKGCGTAKGDGTFGNPVLTDVVLK